MKPVVATYADSDSFDEAKQLFSSIFHNLTWDAEYAVVAVDLDSKQKQWFEKHGIRVHSCSVPKNSKIHPSLYARIHLFSEEFYIYDLVIYISNQSIVRGNLDLLTNVGINPNHGTFAAVMNWGRPLEKLIATSAVRVRNGLSPSSAKQLIERLRKEYDLTKKGFDPNIFVFRPDEMPEKFAQRIIGIWNKYGMLEEEPGELVFNLAFYETWVRLAPLYNMTIMGEKNNLRMRPDKFDAIILRFVGPTKFWRNSQNYYHAEWQANLDKADEIDTSKSILKQNWTPEKVQAYLKIFFSHSKIDLSLDHLKGLIGQGIKKVNPTLYYKLKERIN